MKLTGEVFCALDVESDYRVTDAIVTPRRISIDWEEDDVKAHLDTTSRDGIHFKGNYGYPTKHSDFEFELTLFKAKHEYLLFGTWCEHDTGDEGVWAFRLWAMAAKRTKSTIKSRPSTVRPIQRNSPTPKRSSSPSRQMERPASKPQRPPLGSVQNGVTSGVPKTESPQERQRTEVQKAAVAATTVPTPILPPSAQLDHLLEITPDQIDQMDRLKFTAELNAAPLSAVFKLAHNAKAPAVRSEAAKAYTNRYEVDSAAQAEQQEKVPKKRVRLYSTGQKGFPRRK